MALDNRFTMIVRDCIHTIEFEANSEQILTKVVDGSSLRHHSLSPHIFLSLFELSIGGSNDKICCSLAEISFIFAPPLLAHKLESVIVLLQIFC